MVEYVEPLYRFPARNCLYAIVTMRKRGRMTNRSHYKEFDGKSNQFTEASRNFHLDIGVFMLFSCLDCLLSIPSVLLVLSF